MAKIRHVTLPDAHTTPSPSLPDVRSRVGLRTANGSKMQMYIKF